jgi:hypothetical protein
MAPKNSVTLRLGSEGAERVEKNVRAIAEAASRSFEGASRTAQQASRSFEAFERRLDPLAKSAYDLARAQAAASNAVSTGAKTQAEAARLLELAEQRHRTLTAAVNGNAKAVGLARHEWINLSRQIQDVGVSLAGGQSPLTVLVQQGTQIADIFSSSRAGAGAALRGFAAQVASVLTPARLMTAGLVAGMAAVAIETHKATTRLAEMADASQRTGISVGAMLGANIIGARVGLDGDKTTDAFARANQQFEAFKRNEGDVKKALEAIDENFLKVADKAKTTGEFIDAIAAKIRSLPYEEGFDLATKLFGDDAARRLFDTIREGSFSMRALGEEARKAGAEMADGPARAALQMRREIEETAIVADTKLLAAFGRLADPVQALALAWQKVKLAVADAALKAKADADVAHELAKPHQTGGENAADVFARMRNFRQPIGRLIPLDEARGLSQPEEAGASRARYSAREDKAEAGSKTARDAIRDYIRSLHEAEAAATAEANAWAKGNVEREKALALAKAEALASRDGKTLTSAQRSEIEQTVERTETAKQGMEEMRDAQNRLVQSMNEIRSTASSSMSSFVNDLIHGKSAGDALKSVLDRISQKLIDIAANSVTDSLFGAAGKTGGGLFGDLFSSLFSGGGEGLASGLSSLFSFAEGGVMSSAGPLPLRRYASGGIASGPQLALFGEGRGPEAFVPLPDGRSIPVAIRSDMPPARGGGPSAAQNVFHFNFPPGTDAASFRQSEGQISAMLLRAMARGQRFA